MIKFKDFSLRNKLFSTLGLFIISPLIIIGIIFTVWMSRTDRAYIYESNLEVLMSVHKNTDLIFADVADAKTELMVNGWMQRIVKDYATKKDFWNFKIWYDSTSRNKEYFYNFTLLDGTDILLQRGKIIEKANQEYADRLSQEANQDFWSAPYELDVFPVYTEDRKAGKPAVLTYFSKVSGEFADGLQPIICFSIEETEICNTYEVFLNRQSIESTMVNADGIVYSSTDKSLLGKKYPLFLKRDTRFGEENGYFRTAYKEEKAVVFFSRSKDTGWYLINVVPANVIFSAKAPYLIIVLAVACCILFGIVFAVIQQSYIIRPLEKLLVEMKKLKQGKFDILVVDTSKDEIGSISQEFEHVSRRLEKLIQEVYISKIYTQEAELRLLTSQINPHFLYNTLDSIRWRAIRNKDYDVSEQIEALADLFRHVLNQGADMVTVDKEIDHLKSYMFIMNARYKDRVCLQIQMEDKIAELRMPKLIIQPLVENAFLHGIEPKAVGGTIQVSVVKKDQLLEIVVEDDGVGCDEQEIRKQLASPEKEQELFALKNIDQRIKLKYGSQYGMDFHSTVGKGTVVHIIFPLEGGNLYEIIDRR